MFLILASSAAALAVATPIHSAEITHASNAYLASYKTESTLRLREVESRFANRPSVPVCRWQAELVVNRDVAAQGRTLAAVAKPIHRFAPCRAAMRAIAPPPAARSRRKWRATAPPVRPRLSPSRSRTAQFWSMSWTASMRCP